MTNRSKKQLGGSSHPLWMLKHSAQAYAIQWDITDRRFIDGLAFARLGRIDANTLGELAAKYMVARGFKRDGDQTKPDLRWVKAAREVAAVLKKGLTPNERVARLADRLGRVAPVEADTPDSLVSAATKFLWFAGQHDVRILDVRAVRALKKLGGEVDPRAGYPGFSEAWDWHLSNCKQEIRSTIDLLPAQLEWTCISPDRYVMALRAFKQPWFVDRVFDKYLWTLGAKDFA